MTGVRNDLLFFIANDATCQDEIKKAIANENALGHLTRIFNEITFFNDTPIDKNVSEYISNIKRGNFSGWVSERTLHLVEMLINPDGTLKNDVLSLFANAASLTDEKMKHRLYGDPLNPDRVKQVANMIVSSAVTAISLVLSGRMNDYPELKKMTHYITNLKDGEPVDDRLVTFKTLSRQLSFEELMRYKNRAREVESFIEKTDEIIRHNTDLLSRLGIRDDMINILIHARKSIDQNTLGYRPLEFFHQLLKNTLAPYQANLDAQSQRDMQNIISQIVGTPTKQNVIHQSIQMRLGLLEAIMDANPQCDESDKMLIQQLYSDTHKLARHVADKESFAILAKNLNDILLHLFKKYLPEQSDLLKQYRDACEKLLNGVRFGNEFDPAVTRFTQSLTQIKQETIKLLKSDHSKQARLHQS